MPGELLKIRASVVPAAIGLDRTLTRYQAYRQVAYAEEKPVTDYVLSLREFGNDREPEAISYVEAVTGEMVWYTGQRQLLFESGRFTGHPDGLINDDAIVEVKSRAPENDPYSFGDRHWIKHMAQIQQLLYLTERELCYFGCYCVDRESRLWKVWRNENYITKLHELLDEFCRYVDGEEVCPRKIKKRPVMPNPQYELIDGPADIEIDVQLVTSIALEKAKDCTTIDELNELEEELFTEYPDFSSAIIHGTKDQRTCLTQTTNA